MGPRTQGPSENQRKPLKSDESPQLDRGPSENQRKPLKSDESPLKINQSTNQSTEKWIALH
jgi:hypothetical protein